MRLIGLAVILSVTLAPLAGEAQQAASLPRIGFLAPGSLSEPRIARFFQAFRQGLRELGYVEGQNIAIESRWAEEQYDRLPGLAAELVRLKVNVIVAGGGPGIQAAKQATETIPIVMVGTADPVAAGFVASLARPGGNITGLSLMLPELDSEARTERLDDLAAQLVRLNVDLIVAWAGPETEAAKRATKSIPIVFLIHGDPVGVGHVASLAKPGGNITQPARDRVA